MMARLARLVVPGLAHHVTQRGNRRERTFFEEGDYALYRDLLAEAAHKAQAEIWSYCLMPNHVHIILIPSDEDGLRCTFGDLHRRYTGYVNARMRTTGHLWQGRFGSVAMDGRICTMRFATSRLTQCAHGWWSGRRIGPGQARRR